MENFNSREEAFNWMEETVDDPYVDNYRIADESNAAEVAKYYEMQNRGCCGFFDSVILVNNIRTMIGCNFGH